MIVTGPKRVEGQVDLGATFVLTQRINERVACSYIHSSDPHHGVPFNNKPEYTLDTVGCGVRWGGQRR
jgi:hypothetical protein